MSDKAKQEVTAWAIFAGVIVTAFVAVAIDLPRLVLGLWWNVGTFVWEMFL